MIFISFYNTIISSASWKLKEKVKKLKKNQEKIKQHLELLLFENYLHSLSRLWSKKFGHVLEAMKKGISLLTRLYDLL